MTPNKLSSQTSVSSNTSGAIDVMDDEDDSLLGLGLTLNPLADDNAEDEASSIDSKKRGHADAFGTANSKRTSEPKRRKLSDGPVATNLADLKDQYEKLMQHLPEDDEFELSSSSMLLATTQLTPKLRLLQRRHNLPSELVEFVLQECYLHKSSLEGSGVDLFGSVPDTSKLNRFVTEFVSGGFQTLSRYLQRPNQGHPSIYDHHRAAINVQQVAKYLELASKRYSCESALQLLWHLTLDLFPSSRKVWLLLMFESHLTTNRNPFPSTFNNPSQQVSTH